jgi:hypothetical protein
MMKEKDEMANREEEMQTVIQRLKDSLAQRNLDEDRPTRQCTFFLFPLASHSPETLADMSSREQR